jgi:hypothetical protein
MPSLTLPRVELARSRWTVGGFGYRDRTSDWR